MKDKQENENKCINISANSFRIIKVVDLHINMNINLSLFIPTPKRTIDSSHNLINFISNSWDS